MILDSIKKILGDELTEKIETALSGKGKDGKDIYIVVGNDGSFVPADKHEGVKTRAENAEKALKSASDAMKEIGGSGDPEKIADDVKTAQNTINTLQTDHQSEIAKIQKNTALKMALSGQAHDPSDVISLLNMESIEVDDAGNLKSDLEGLLKPIRETKSYLFKEQEQAKNPDIKGAKPADPGGTPDPAATASPVIF